MSNEITEVAPGIFSFAHRVADGKNAIILGERGAVAVDVCMHSDEGQAMADFIRSKGFQPNRVILTHGHSDHVLGGAAFRGAEVFASTRTPAVMAAQLRDFATRHGESPDVLLAQALHPTVMFSQELYLDHGGKHLHLFPTPGHSEDCISIYIPENCVMIASDTVVTGIIPAIFYDSSTLENSLRLLQTFDIEILIPGHGEVIHGALQIRDWLAWIQGYIRGVREAVQAHPDLEESELVEQISYETFVGSRLPEDRHNMRQRHRTTVLKIIQEERTTC
ncbi:MAG TPA: MBL fold metallo-hydrolase [Aggregatilineales bacterium]|nr:MBL fold metallo-hydrolase [Aggregatilineales bacterium]